MKTKRPTRRELRLLALLQGMLDDYEDQFGANACDCRPEPENAGHVCNACKARAELRDSRRVSR